MENLKIRVNSESESKEVQELFFELGYSWNGNKKIQELSYPVNGSYWLCTKNGMSLFNCIKWGTGHDSGKLITLPQLRDLVILKRNDVGDATHIRGDGKKYFHAKSTDFFYQFSSDGDWLLSTWMNYQLLPQLQPIEKPMKEYLRKNSNGTYSYIGMVRPENVSDFMIEIPEGATYYAKDANLGKSGNFFFRLRSDGFDFEAVWLESNWMQASFNVKNQEVLWSRHTLPEELPFIDDEPLQSLNDQYAEIEKVRQHNHYFKDVSSLNEIDVYMVLKLFNVTDPCLQHIAKKALCAGQRGHKNFNRDLRDILDTAKRAVEINNG